ncbi:MAG: hypothetical protein HQ463_01725 [Bacteroidetes bacterium]|nr:hypothetical protein [Bacteroidota bacterium]
MAIAEIIEHSDEMALEEELVAMEVADEDYKVDAKIFPTLTLENAKIALTEFSDKQTPALKTLLKMVDFEIEGNNLVVKLSLQQMEMTDKIKVEWQSFLRQYFNLKNLFLLIKESEDEITTRKAYTAREQLDEMLIENPELMSFIQKFNLKLK